MTKRPTGRIGIELTITNSDTESLERFQRIVGVGGIRPTTGNYLSKKELWRWYAYSREDFWTVITLLLPHLSSRRQKRAQEVMTALAEYVDGRSTHWSKREPVLDAD